MTTQAQITSGYTDDGRPFVPGVNCDSCGRFVGRDGHIEIECFEMSSTVASVSGECGRCLPPRRSFDVVAQQAVTAVTYELAPLCPDPGGGASPCLESI